MCKSKNRYFYHISVSPWDAPGAITLNVVWMEREFDAYKLSRCMCPSNYKRFWDRARYLWKKSSFYHTLLHSTPPIRGFPSEYRHPLWYGKTRMVSLPDCEKISKIDLCLFVLTWSTNVTDGRTDRHCMTAKTALMHRIARKNGRPLLKYSSSTSWLPNTTMLVATDWCRCYCYEATDEY